MTYSKRTTITANQWDSFLNRPVPSAVARFSSVGATPRKKNMSYLISRRGYDGMGKDLTDMTVEELAAYNQAKAAAANASSPGVFGSIMNFLTGGVTAYTANQQKAAAEAQAQAAAAAAYGQPAPTNYMPFIAIGGAAVLAFVILKKKKRS